MITTTTEIDWQARRDEVTRDVRAARIGLAQWLVLEVILDYSFGVKRAEAWIPNLDVFVLRTGMRKKEIGETLAKLESFGIVEWDDAKEERFPYAQRYRIYPTSARAWSIAPRLQNKRLQEKAATIDRWLRELNAGGGPEQGDLFPPSWEHADTLAEWSPRSDAPPKVSPDRLQEATPQPPHFQLGSSESDRPLSEPGSTAETREDAIRCATRVSLGLLEEVGVGKNPTLVETEAPPDEIVGKYPTPNRGEKPHALLMDWNGVNERDLSHLNQSKPFNAESVGKNPTAASATLSCSAPPAASEENERPEHWPVWEVENRLMRQIGDQMRAYYAPAVAQHEMAKFGALWRWRIRQWPMPVEHALMIAAAQWSEIKDLGKFLNAEWKKVWKKRQALQQAEEEKREAEREAEA